MALCRSIAGVLSLSLGSLLAQTAAQPAFEVASVKALAGATHGGPETISPDGINFPGSSLGYLIRWAYGLHPYQSFETVGPSWIEPGLGCVWFSIVAKADGPVPVAQLRLMLRTLLAERLKLSLHREMKDMPVYVLTVAKDGPKFHKSEKETDDWPKARGVGLVPAFEFHGAPMSRLLAVLSANLTRLLLDETGLEGGYDFTLDESKYQDYVTRGENGRADMDAAYNKALQDIGLRLEPKRRPVEVLVIDHAEKTPVEN
jgi:uncharacterized protein (TIGR03435 family)